ncbi:MAG: DUF5710 domain-containing protein [Methylococcales bacterium]|nr:DUF5710 domain-containing protein [Methylococcales bacterium]
MSSSKIYLNVPYAEKDAAKSLGAKWDAAIKKWYAPTGADISLFSKWCEQAAGGQSDSAPTGNFGVFTRPAIKDFVAYDGDLPPWD